MREIVNPQDFPLYTLHCPGKARLFYKGLLEECANKIIKVSDKITIITVATSNLLTTAPLIQQLEKSGIPYGNPVSKIDGGRWTMTLKLLAFKDCLAQVQTPYALLMDANDAVILEDLDDNFIAKFEDFHCDVLYNGTTNRHPNVTIESKAYHSGHHIYNYLNAGVCFGRTEALKEIYTDAYTLAKYSNATSEQFFIRKIWAKMYKRIAVDRDMLLFACLHHNDGIIKDGMVKIYRKLWHFTMDFIFSWRG